MSSKVLSSLLACLRREEKDTENSSFLKNGSILLEDLIASCDGKSNPIHTYSAGELMRATNNFDPSNIIQSRISYKMFRGFLDNRSIFVKQYCVGRGLQDDEARSRAIRDIVVSIQMSTHRNVLKLLGCCLEFSIPALVKEYATQGVLNDQGGFRANESLPWKIRIHIAKHLANALTYLHTAFPRPIIQRDLTPNSIMLGDDYVPKLSDFSVSITIPPMQSHAEDVPKGVYGYLDPSYMTSGYISEKSDVYSLGVLLLLFLTGQKAVIRNQEGEYESIIAYVKFHTCDGQIQRIVDPKISGEMGVDEQTLQCLHDFLDLALSCTQDENEARPDMIDVAKELVQIDKFILPSLA